MNKMARKPTIHKKEMVLDKDKLRDIIDSRNMEYMELHERVVDEYGLDLTYKGFMSLISNRSTWKLLYAHAITDVLQVDYMEIFKVINIDKEKALKEKAIWNRKYGNNKNKG